MRFRDDESGQMLVLTALSLALLLGFMAMALDVGLLFRAKRNVQLAADAAATAAALDFHYNLSVTSAQAAGKAASQANGIQNGVNGNVVVVNMPPVNGPNTAYTSFAEAIVTEPNPTFFMKLFGIGSVNVVARAVAGNPAGSKACGYITNPTAAGALSLQGAYSITGGTVGGVVQPACGIVVASTSPDAVNVTGSGGTLDASYIATAGGAGGSGSTSPTTITTGVVGLPTDPLASEVSKQAQPPSCTQTSALTSITTTNVGSVKGSTSNNVVCFTNAVTIGNGVTLPGASTTSNVVYVFENGVTIGVGATVQFGSGGPYDATNNTFPPTTVGATMEIYGGSLTQASNSVLSIYAPQGGDTNAIAIWQPTANTNPLQVQFGSNNEVLDGFIYAPGADVILHDNGGGVTATGVVANTMKIKSSSMTLPNYNTANAETTPLTQIVLVE